MPPVMQCPSQGTGTDGHTPHAHHRADHQGHGSPTRKGGERTLLGTNDLQPGSLQPLLGRHGVCG